MEIYIHPLVIQLRFIISLMVIGVIGIIDRYVLELKLFVMCIPACPLTTDVSSKALDSR